MLFCFLEMSTETGDYRPRILESELEELLGSLPALAIEGVKGVGKTAMASRRARTVYALDDPEQLELVAADPTRLLSAKAPILIDEWQRLPQTWDLVRRAVDDGAGPATFLLTGSASPDGIGTHSGAGRIPLVRMRPLALSERLGTGGSVSLGALLEGGRPALKGETSLSLEDYTEEILASGLPGLRRYSGRALRAQVDGFLERVVDHDLPELGRQVRNPAGLRRWLRAYAAASSTTTTLEKIRAAAAGSGGEVLTRKGAGPYRDALERLWILDPVPGWSPSRSHLSRLATSDKHQLADPALAARLVGATKTALLRGESFGPKIPRDGTFLGALFESLATLSIRVYAQAAEADVKHLRTYSGDHEVDLIVQRDDERVVAVEVKLTTAPGDQDLRHLHWLRRTIGDELLDAIVITTGRSAYRRSDGIGVVPLALLGP
jgi:predicted AAA+ superfamily ATPase